MSLPLAIICHFVLLIDIKAIFWATVSKMVRPMVSDHRLSVCFVCNVGVLWPNGWMDQDATWYEGRPSPRPHCI